jgi:hypothetical protein
MNSDNWKPFNKVENKIKVFFEEKIIKVYKSEDEAIDKAMINLKKTITESLGEEIKNLKGDEDKISNKFTEISKRILKELFQIVLNKEKGKDFSEELKSLFILFIGDIIGNITELFPKKKEDFEKILGKGIEKLFKNFSKDIQFPVELGKTLFINYITNLYNERYPILNKFRNKEKEDDILDECLEEKVDILNEKDLDELLNNNEIEEINLKEKEGTNLKEKTNLKEEKWEKGLTKEEIEEIKTSIKKDQMKEIKINKFSEIYLSGGSNQIKEAKIVFKKKEEKIEEKDLIEEEDFD